MNTEESTLKKLREMAYGYVPAQLVYVAASLGLADLLANGPKGHEELAATVEAHAPSLGRALRGMVDLGLFEEDREGCVHLTPLSQPLRKDAPRSMHDSIVLHGGELTWRAWGELLHSVKTGETAFERAFGVPFFDYLDRHPETAATFNRAPRTTGGTARLAEAIVEGVELTGVSRIVDVGGSDGVLIEALLRILPHATGVVFDRGPVVAEARERLSARPLAERCTCVAGDFFEAVPEGGDLYLLSRILHDWDTQRCLAILRNCRRAIARGGLLLILERVLAASRLPADPSGVRPEVRSDLDMLVTTGGRERSEQEYRELLEASGFVLKSLTPVPTGVADIIEATPGTVR